MKTKPTTCRIIISLVIINQIFYFAIVSMNNKAQECAQRKPIKHSL